MSLNIAVVCGGRSSEAEVSRMSAGQVAAALRGRGHRCTLLEADAELWPALQAGTYDAAFIAVHGRFGEDGSVQGVCELLNLAYTGSDLIATALCFDKARAKSVFRAGGIATPDWREIDETGDVAAQLEAAADDLGLPLVVKPRRGGSTIGLTIVEERSGLRSAHALAAEHGEVLCERLVRGTEVTVGILGHNPPQALPTLEIVSHRPLYDYAAKYTAGQSEHIIPARLPDERNRAAQRAGLDAHRALGCRDLSRVDVIVDDEGTCWVLEVNAIPGLTELSLLPDAARAAGVGVGDLCQQLVDSALARHRETVR
jgi:D-alanine-D-alanine ligase